MATIYSYISNKSLWFVFYWLTILLISTRLMWFVLKPQCTFHWSHILFPTLITCKIKNLLYLFISAYLCHGSWTENSTVYIVAKNQATQHGVCISYKQLDGNDGLLVVGDSCYRGLQKPPDHHFVANLTLAGTWIHANFLSSHFHNTFHTQIKCSHKLQTILSNCSSFTRGNRAKSFISYKFCI